MAKQKLYDANGNEVNAKIKKPFYKKWWVWLLGVIVVVGVAGGGSDDSTTNKDNTASQKEGNSNGEATKDVAQETEEKVYGIGDEVTVGEWAYTVNSVSEQTKITREYIGDLTTSGKFLILDVTVKNNDKEAKFIDSGMFKVVDADGLEFSSNTEADIYINEGTDTGFMLEEVNPKMSETGKISFEIPTDSTDLQLQVSSGFWGTEYETVNLQ